MTQKEKERKSKVKEKDKYSYEMELKAKTHTSTFKPTSCHCPNHQHGKPSAPTRSSTVSNPGSDALL